MKFLRFPLLAALLVQAACASEPAEHPPEFVTHWPPGGNGTVSFSVDGQTKTYDAEAAGMLDEEHRLTMIKALTVEGDPSTRVFLAVESLEPGTYSARGGYVLVELHDQGAKWRSFDSASITLSRIGNVGEPIAGTFTAWVSPNGEDEPKRLVANGEFEVVRVAK